jgi:hypothetical protein
LIYEIQTIQMQDRHRFTAALEQIESNRLQDSTWARNRLQNLALRTEGVWQPTRHDVEQFPSEPNSSDIDPYSFRDANILERKE